MVLRGSPSTFHRRLSGERIAAGLGVLLRFVLDFFLLLLFA